MRRPTVRVACLVGALGALPLAVAPAQATTATSVEATIPSGERAVVGTSAFLTDVAAGRWSYQVDAVIGKITSISLSARMCKERSQDGSQICVDPTGNSVSVSKPTGGQQFATRAELPATSEVFPYYYVKMIVLGTANSSIRVHICPPPTAPAPCTATAPALG